MARTKRIRCGLIGAHIENSKFGAALAMAGARAGWKVEFTPIDTANQPDFDFSATVRRLIGAGWSGVTVTHPYKIEAMALADRRFDAPDRLRSANLLKFDDAKSGGGVAATNTDYLGFLAMWDALGPGGIRPGAPGKVAMVGAGGVARSLAAALDDRGAEDIAVWDTTPGAAPALAAEIGGAVRAVTPIDAPALIAAADGLVNATPLGMAAHPGSAFDAGALGPQAWAFDAVYAPAPTPFALDAAAAGLICLTGHDLFRHMLLASFAAYTGETVAGADVLGDLRALSAGAAR